MTVGVRQKHLEYQHFPQACSYMAIKKHMLPHMMNVALMLKNNTLDSTTLDVVVVVLVVMLV